LKKSKSYGKWIYWFSLAIAVIFVYKTLDSSNNIWIWIKDLLGLVMPFILGIIFAYLFYVPCRKVENLYKKVRFKFIKRISRGLSVLTVYVLALLLIFIIIKCLLPIVSESFMSLASNIPNYYNNAVEYVNNLPEDSILIKLNIEEAIKRFKQIDLNTFFNPETVIEYVKGAIGVANAIFGIFVTIIVSIYILLERHHILIFIKDLLEAVFKKETYEKVYKYFLASNEIFLKFIYTQILDALIMGVIVSIALIVMEVEYGALLGFTIGVFNVIPYFGAIIAVGIAILITVFTEGLTKAIWVGAIIIIIQQLDANILNPRIVGNSLRLSPLIIIFAVTVGGAYFGILGMFLSVPIAALIKLILTDYIKNKKIKKR